ncbi:MAG TPA: class I SAM-dependent methyltransferase, partial [Fibrobacteria bacterium]|nr:class I SAM-dependent methyltransferase [Fibrobacteria bacterium]
PAERALLARLATELPRLAALDLGVGGGRTAVHLASRAGSYIGVDYAPAMVEACRRRFAGSLPAEAFAVEDARRLPQGWTARFGFVLFSYNGLDFLGHGDRLAALAEMARVAAPGAHVVFSSHNLGAIGASGPPSPPGIAGKAAAALDRALFRALNPGLKRKVKAPHCVLRDRGNRGRARNYYIRPEAQARQLAEAGLELLDLYPAREDTPYPSLAAAAVSQEPWIYYLARKPARRAFPGGSP